MMHEVRQLTEGFTDTQWYWAPTAKAWSISYCIDHLNVVHTLLLPRFEAAIEQARAQGKYSDGPFHYGLFDRLFVRMMGPNAPLKQQAPRLYRPAPHPGAPDIVLSRFRHNTFQIRQSSRGRSSRYALPCGALRAGLSSPRTASASCVMYCAAKAGTPLTATASRNDPVGRGGW